MTAGRRVHERYERKLEVTTKWDSETLECVSRNVSLGGMFLVSESSVPYGTEVELTFLLPALKEHVTVAATVRWSGPDGFGVQFGSLRAREVWALNQFFKATEAAEAD